MNTANQSEEKIEALLLDLIAPIRYSDDTLLHFEIDTRAVADPVWENFVNALTPKEVAEWRDWPKIESMLSAIVGQALLNQTDSADTSGADNESEQTISEGAAQSPAAWLDRLLNKMRDIDHRALEILALYVEGYADRDISEQLETGLRCIKQITRDMQLTWKGEASRT